MAHMDIHYGFSVNGVAALHTEILKNSELKPFFDLYPQKFNNKTNGVTFRRWLEACDPRLSALIDDCIGDSWRRDAQKLEGLLAFREMTISSSGFWKSSRRTRTTCAGPFWPGREWSWTLCPCLTSRSSACMSTSASR